MTEHAADQRIVVWALGRDGGLTTQILSASGFDALAVDRCEDLVNELSAGAAVFIVAAERLADPDSDHVRHWLQQQPPWSELPVIIVSPEAQQALGALEELSGVTVLHRPLSLDTLRTTVAMSLRARRRQYEVRDLLAQLEEATKRRDEFLAMLAHELRNPLSPIRTGLQVLRISDSAEITTRVHTMIERQVTHLSRLIDDLLNVSRVMQGKIALQTAEVDLQATLGQVADAWHRLATEKALTVVVEDATDPIIVNGDSMRLEQMLGNVLWNAIKYTAAQGRIVLSARREGTWAAVRVRDTGVGIDPTMLQSIFNLFEQAAQPLARSAGGLGVGLTVVKHLVELHGGKVEALSEGVGHGTEIVIRLPLSSKGQTATKPAVVTKQTRVVPRNVLLIEDNRDTAETLAIYLRSSGHTVHVTYDGEEGLASAERLKPEVVICDIGLPFMDGYQVATHIRTQSSIRDSLLIALTGYGEARDRERGLAAGFDRYIVKPADPEELLQLLHDN